MVRAAWMEKNMRKTAERESEHSVLSDEQLGHLSGGMIWDHNYVNPEVIDARGGGFNILGLVYVTLDVNGKISSVGPA
jgi:hypothetical protein